MQLTIAILIAALGAAILCAVSGSGPAGPLREAANSLDAQRTEALQLITHPSLQLITHP